MRSIGIVELGIGNLGSLRNALFNLGFEYQPVRTEAESMTCDALILPGVGSFAHGMALLSTAGLIDGIRRHAAQGKPLLGICLGAQLLFEEGSEGGDVSGLGLIPGRVRKLNVPASVPLPHVGWNEFQFDSAHPVLKGIKSGIDFYFVHSYCVDCPSEFVVGSTDYHEIFVSAVSRNNVFGVQFHPEKSQRNGLRLLENFCWWDGRC